jgi:hypothetical protein
MRKSIALAIMTFILTSLASAEDESVKITTFTLVNGDTVKALKVGSTKINDTTTYTITKLDGLKTKFTSDDVKTTSEEMVAFDSLPDSAKVVLLKQTLEQNKIAAEKQKADDESKARRAREQAAYTKSVEQRNAQIKQQNDSNQITQLEAYADGCRKLIRDSNMEAEKYNVAYDAAKIQLQGVSANDRAGSTLATRLQNDMVAAAAERDKWKAAAAANEQHLKDALDKIEQLKKQLDR